MIGKPRAKVVTFRMPDMVRDLGKLYNSIVY